MSAESKIAALGITLPDAPKPGGVSIFLFAFGINLTDAYVKEWVSFTYFDSL